MNTMPKKIKVAFKRTHNVRRDNMFKKLYSQVDFNKLLNEELNEIEEIIDVETPKGHDKREYLYSFIDKIENDEKANEIVRKKALAGSCSIIWYNFSYDSEFTKDNFIKELRSEHNNFNEDISLDTQTFNEGIMSIVEIDEKYIVRYMILDGKQRIVRGTTVTFEPRWKLITILIDVENMWVEIRGNENIYDKIEKILSCKLHIKNYEKVSLLKKYDNDINKLKCELPEGFYYKIAAMPKRDISMGDEVDKVCELVQIIDLYIENKDEQELLSALSKLKLENSNIKLRELFLAGMSGLNISLRPDENQNHDMEKQPLYNITKDSIDEDTSYIKFCLEVNNKIYDASIKVSLNRNSIYYINSVTEDVIDYIRKLIL